MVIRSLGRNRSHDTQRGRAMLLLAMASIWGLVVIARLGYLQVYLHDALVERAASQQTRVIDLAGRRGDIFARGGETLATSIQLGSVYAQPPKITDAVATARLLAPPLGLPTDTVVEMLSRQRSFVYLRRKARPETTAEVSRIVRRERLRGIGILPESKRYYPHRSLAAHVVGAVDIDNAGRFGIERYYDDLIAGQPGAFNSLRDGWRNVIGTSGALMEDPTRGHDLVLTLDWGLQHAAEEALRSTVLDKHAAGGSIVAMDPRTGAIRALASFPTLNLNDNNDPSFLAHARNNGVAFSFEPGSVFKVITAAAALHEGVVHEDEPIDCEGGTYRVATHTYHDWKLGFGIMPFRDVLAFSSNVGTIKVCQRLTPQTYYSWIRDFGFGSHTEIDLPNEEPGRVTAPENWSKLSQSSMAFGQELSTTPIQMTTAIAAIANGGLLLRPYLVEQIRDRHGNTLTEVQRAHGKITLGQPHVRRRVLKESIARRVGLVMERVVTGGTGAPAGIPGYRIAGKTSTAEKWDPSKRAYSQYVAAFVGFLPADDPQLVILVVIDEPKRGYGHHGSQAAVPAFRTVAVAATRLLRMAPENSPVPEEWVTDVPEMVPSTRLGSISPVP